ncbi:MAG: hypothetical protein WCY29_08185 [Novosphingobium sp.]
MSEAVLERSGLSADEPGRWLDDGYERLMAMSWRDCLDVQLRIMQRRFDELVPQVAALEKLARREGITAIASFEDALPLFFDHRVYKSYPLSLIETRDFPRLTSWLNRLTTHDLTQMDLAGLTMIDDWIDRLDAFGMFIGHSTGTTGKLSFIPRSQTELHAFRNCHNEASRASSGVNPWNDPIETFFPGYRYGHQMAIKMVSTFNIPAAGGEAHYHTLYPGRISADLMSLAGRMQAAEDRGELERLGLDPALLKAREELIAQGQRREQDIEAFFNTLFEDFRGQRVKIGGTFGDLIRTARSGIEKGIKPEFAPGSFIGTGGGMKGFKDPPADWESYVKDFFGIETVSMVYGMSEGCGFAPRCSHGYFHTMPHTVPFLFDRDMKLLPREGVQTGRYAFFDLQAETYWGGFISGDQVTIHWEEDCDCGWKGPRVGPTITRFAEMEGGDDKISCAGTAQAYNDFMDFVSQVQ